MYTKLCGEGSFNFLKNILVKYLRKQMYKIPFFPVFHLSSEQWIYLGVFVWHTVIMTFDEPYMMLQIILNYVKCTEILKSACIPNFPIWTIAERGGIPHRSLSLHLNFYLIWLHGKRFFNLYNLPLLCNLVLFCLPIVWFSILNLLFVTLIMLFVLLQF